MNKMHKKIQCIDYNYCHQQQQLQNSQVKNFTVTDIDEHRNSSQLKTTHHNNILGQNTDIVQKVPPPTSSTTSLSKPMFIISNNIQRNKIQQYNLQQNYHSYEQQDIINTEPDEHHYYSIPELNLLSTIVSSNSSSTSTTTTTTITMLNKSPPTPVSTISSSSSSSSSSASLSFRHSKQKSITTNMNSCFAAGSKDDRIEKTITKKAMRKAPKPPINNEEIELAEVELRQRKNSNDSMNSITSIRNENWNYCEQSIIGARASVMVYDDAQKKWVPSGTSSGLSKVQIYHHQQNNTFRVVGRKLQDHEVVINCSILKGLKYNQATVTFHQWRDSKYVYGLNFSSQQDAEAFARAMMHALDVLSGRVIPNTAPPPPTNGNGYDEDMGYRTMTREDAAIALQQQQTLTGNTTPSAQTPTSQNNQNIPQSPPAPQGHHRTSRNSISAPPAPQPPPMSMPPQMYQQSSGGMNGIMQQQQLPQPPSQQQIQQQMQQQSQYHVPQVTQQQTHNQQQHHHPVYSSQTSVNNYNQYQQPNYVTSNSNHNLNQAPPPQPPPHQNGGGPIYVPSQQAQGIPTSASTNSVVYTSQQQQQQQPQLQLQPQQQQQQQQQSQLNNYGQTNGISTTDGGGSQSYGQIPMTPPIMSGTNIQNNGIPMPPPGGPMVIRSGSAPAAPPPPPAGFGGGIGNFTPPQPPPLAPLMAPMGAPQPPAPPMMSVGGAPPPPPPPPIGGLSLKTDDGGLMGSLAAQLQQARLKKNKTTPPPAENSGSSTSSGGSGNYGTIGRTSHGMASMMDEMAKTLARRRAQAEKKEPEPAEDNNSKQRPWEKSNTLPHKLGSGSNSNSNNNNNNNGGNTNSGSESPRPIRKRFGSASEETILKQVNGEGLSLSLSADLDSIKAELVREMRLEIQKAKQEIIEAIKSEFNRR